jgi:diguanylate cyclase (GGDEF)-like protein
MKRLMLAFAVLLGWVSPVWAAPAAEITSLKAVRLLTNAEAHRQLPVAFEGTVTYYRKGLHNLFLQDHDLAIYVMAVTDVYMVPGDRVLVRGTTRDSFRPIVISHDVTVLRHGDIPRPKTTSYGELVRAQLDGMLVTVRGVIRATDLVRSALDSGPGTILQLYSDAGYIDVFVNNNDPTILNSLLDAQVEITGVAGGTFDDKMQLTGIRQFVQTMANVRILKQASSDPWSLPLTAMDQILSGYQVNKLTPRIRVHGAITYYQPGSTVVLQDGAKSVRVMTETQMPMRIGDLVDATGIPDLRDGFLTLTHGEFRDSNIQAAIRPVSVSWDQLANTDDMPSGHLFDLVSATGQVVTEVREATQDEYVLAADGHLFSAIYFHPSANRLTSLPAMKLVTPGSRVQITGICTPHAADPLNGPVEFDLLLRSFDDITVISEPPLWSAANLTRIVIGLLLLVITAGAWGAVLMRKVHRQTKAMASRTEAEAILERKRSRILEDTNGTESLAAILEQIVEMVSFMLGEAPCWCEITDGARIGNCPPDSPALRVVQEEIPTRNGPPAGTIFAALDPLKKDSRNESDALSTGARLATLAFESRRLYSDLRHRSEFDPLTDIYNRFSLEKHLDAEIDRARDQAGIFGLIYIDLDGFKLVNDLYGHLVGDLYLQEVTRRMKQQLRSHDLLARLGGDEFAALLPLVRGRTDVEDIALRLERSYDDPLLIEGYTLHGSASFGIALYPQDGLTREFLLSAADAAMYKVKHARRQMAQMLDGKETPGK